MLALTSLEPFALSNLHIATVLGKLGKFSNTLAVLLQIPPLHSSSVLQKSPPISSKQPDYYGYLLVVRSDAEINFIIVFPRCHTL